jgi:hypothetical protein
MTSQPLSVSLESYAFLLNQNRRILMKNITFALSLLFVFSICGFAQISKSNPLGGEIKETLNNTDSKVFVEVELLKEEEASLSVPLANVSNIEMTVINVTEKLPSGTSKTTPVNRSATNISDASQPMKRLFQVEISNSPNVVLSPVLQLPRNWESLTYKISSILAGEAQPKTTAVLHMQRANDATVQKFTVKVGKPIWIQDANGVKSNDLIVPITSISASLVADVILTQGTAKTNPVKPVLLLKNEQKAVILNVQDFGTQSMEIRFKPTELDGVQLVLTGESCSNTPNDPFCTLTSEFKLPFQINQADSDLRDLKITSLASSKTIRIRTIGVAKPNSLIAKLNGNPINVSGSVNSFQITFDTNTLKSLSEGDNTLEFEGESLEGIKLSEKPFKFQKTTKPRLVGYPTFSIDSATNALKLNYELSGDVMSSEPKLTFRDTAGTIGTFRNPNCRKENGNTKCSPELLISFESLTAEDKRKTTIPVRLDILAQEQGDSSLESVGSNVGFDLINQGAIKSKLDEIRARWKTNNNKDAAVREIAQVLNVDATNEKAVETFDKYVKESDSSEKRKKFFQFLVGVGNFALKGFGIPITIPTNIAN